MVSRICLCVPACARVCARMYACACARALRIKRPMWEKYGELRHDNDEMGKANKDGERKENMGL